jgi:glycosyltransferase involved in cell wall biosynthesis
MRDVAPGTSNEQRAAADPERIEPPARRAEPALGPHPTPRQRDRAALRVAIDARKLTDAESGIGSYTLNLVKGLLQEDENLELLLIRHGRRPHERFENPRVEEAYVPFYSDSPLGPLTMGHVLRRHRFDVFHSPFDHVPRGLTQPVVVTIHDVNWIVNPAYNSHNGFMRLAGGFFYRTSLIQSMHEANRIIAISNATRNAIVEYAPWHEPKIRVVYNGVDRSRVFPMEKDAASRALEHLIDTAHPFVLTVGQGSPYKNHLNAVRGFLEAFRDRPDYRMILVRRSAGADKALERLLRSPQARAQVITLRYVTREVLNALYNRARIVLHPSYYEGFGLPLVEAMAAGAPLVTSSVSSMPEVVGSAAVLVSPGDSHAIARALSTLDRDEVLRERLIAAGRQRLGLFDWIACARATLEVYRDVARTEARQSAMPW